MKSKLAITCLILGMTLGPAVALAGADGTDADRAHPRAFIKDSAITTKIKTSLAAQHITSLGRIRVDTDSDGIVTLKGSARSQKAADQAVAVARGTEGVTEVHSRIKIRHDD